MSIFNSLYHVQEAIVENYLKHGLLDPKLVSSVKWIKGQLEYQQLFLNGMSENDVRVYNGVLADLKQIRLMLKNIKGNPDAKLQPNDTEAKYSNDYSFKFWHGADSLFFEIRKDQFFWQIGIAHDGNFTNLNGAINITEYFHCSTNGSVTDLKNALADTNQFFPKTHFHKYAMRTIDQNISSTFNLIHQVLSKDIGSDTGMCAYGTNDIHDFFHEKITEELAEKLIKEFKNIYPSLNTIEKFSSITGAKKFGVTLADEELPLLLSAADIPKKEKKAAKKANAKVDSLKWLVSKSIWKSFPAEKIEQFQNQNKKYLPDVCYLLHKAKKFAK